MRMAAYIRSLVERDLGDERSHADVSAIFGVGASRGSQIANEPDAVADAIADTHRR